MSLSCAWWFLTMRLGKGGQGGFGHLPVGQGAPQGGDNDLNAPFSLHRRREASASHREHALPIGQQRFLMKKSFGERLEKKEFPAMSFASCS